MSSMPKAFGEAEREKIRAALQAAGLRRFERSGLRAARIDDICRDVGIAKGSFYAFFDSKEDLFMSVVEDREQVHQEDMYAFLAETSGSARERAGTFFDLIVRKIESDPILNLVITHNEVPHLLRKLGPERFVTSQERDKTFAAEAVGRWRKSTGVAVKPGDLLSLLTITLALVAQRGQMPADHYRNAVALLRDVFVHRFAGASK
jgi:AcrR family transcriptional regulator